MKTHEQQAKIDETPTTKITIIDEMTISTTTTITATTTTTSDEVTIARTTKTISDEMTILVIIILIKRQRKQYEIKL